MAGLIFLWQNAAPSVGGALPGLIAGQPWWLGKKGVRKRKRPPRMRDALLARLPPPQLPVRPVDPVADEPAAAPTQPLHLGGLLSRAVLAALPPLEAAPIALAQPVAKPPPDDEEALLLLGA